MIRALTLVGVLTSIFALFLVGGIGHTEPPLPGKRAVEEVEEQAPQKQAARPKRRVTPREALTRERRDVLGFEGNTPLREALGTLSEMYGIPIFVDVQAFKDDLQIAEPEQQPVKLPKMSRARLETVLQLLLPQVQGAYLFRTDYLEITTPQRWMTAIWGMRNPSDQVIPVRPRPRLRPVNQRFTDQPLEEAINELMEATGFSIILDKAHAADQAKTKVSATFNNVPLDTAVRLLAQQSGLVAVLLDDVLFVSDDPNVNSARERQKEAERHGYLEPLPSPPAGPGA